MMSEQTILNNAFKAIFTPESIGAPEELNPPEDDIIRRLISSGREDNGNVVANIEVRGMTRAKLDRFGDVTLALFSNRLWKHSIYANDPVVPDYLAFCDKLEELTKRRLFVAIKSEKTGDMNDDTVIKEAFLGLSFGQMDHSKCNSCPTCIAEKQDPYFDELKKQLDTCKEQNSELTIMLPIEYIGDIPVNVYCEKRITRSDVVIYRLQVNLNTFDCYHGGQDPFKLYESDPWGIDMKTLTFEKLKNDISMLMEEEQVWLDVLCGEFRLGKERNDKLKARADLRALFIKTFKGKEGYTLKDKTCCVCYSPTNSITKCGHSLCISCLVGVDKKMKDEREEEDDDDDEVPCPMCRACIRHEWKQ